MLKRCFSLLRLAPILAGPVFAGPLVMAAPSFAASLSADHSVLARSSRNASSVLLYVSSEGRWSGSVGELQRGPLAEGARGEALVVGARVSSLVHPDAEQIAAWRVIYASSLPVASARDIAQRPVDLDYVIASDVGYDASDLETPSDRDAVPAVPEPFSAVAFGLGALLIVVARMRRARGAHSPAESPTEPRS